MKVIWRIVILFLSVIFAAGCGLFTDLENIDFDGEIIESDAGNGDGPGDSDGDGDGDEPDGGDSDTGDSDGDGEDDQFVLEVESFWRQVVDSGGDQYEVFGEVTIDILCQPQECELVECVFEVPGASERIIDPCAEQVVERLPLTTDWDFTVTAELNEEIRQKAISGRVSVEPFESRWAPSEDQQVVLPLVGGGDYDFIVEREGSGQVVHITDGADAVITDILEETTLSIRGTIEGWSFRESDHDTDATTLIKVQKWGPLLLGPDTTGHFQGASNLQITADDWPDLSEVTSLAHSFRGTVNLDEIPGVEDWEVAHITDMRSLFMESAFAGELNPWDVSSVTDMSSMFREAQSFNGEIDTWDVSSVTDMSSMFSQAVEFDRAIGDWDVSSVTDMSSMFQAAESFNQVVGGWDVSSVTDMSFMFDGATGFDGRVENWEVSSVTTMESIFREAALTDTNYSRLLDSWSEQDVQDGVNFHAGGARPSEPEAEGWREMLVDEFCWIIEDGDGVHEGDNCD